MGEADGSATVGLPVIVGPDVSVGTADGEGEGTAVSVGAGEMVSHHFFFWPMATSRFDKRSKGRANNSFMFLFFFSFFACTN